MTILNAKYEDTTITDIQNEILEGQYEDMADLLDQNEMAFGFTDEEISILEDTFPTFWIAKEAEDREWEAEQIQVQKWQRELEAELNAWITGVA